MICMTSYMILVGLPGKVNPGTSESFTDMQVTASCNESNSVSMSGASAETVTSVSFSIDGLCPGCLRLR